MPRSSVLALAGLFSLLAVPARAQPAPRTFSHRTHLKAHKIAKCTNCHTEGAAADKERPAKQDHSACNAEGCHADEFFSAKMGETDLCFVCHVSKDWNELQKRRANIRAFPRGRDRSIQNQDEDRTYLDDWDFYAEFSHKDHLRKGGPVQQKSDEGCLYCHRVEVSAEGKVTAVARPGHEHCSTCHGAAAGQDKPTRTAKAPKNTMSDCNTCHLFRRTEKGDLVATGPVSKRKKGRVSGKFSHDKHRLDRRKKDPSPTSCAVCHDLVVRADRLGDIQTTAGQHTMESACKTCHDGKQKTPNGKLIFDITGQCTLCHQPNFLGDGSAPPHSHR